MRWGQKEHKETEETLPYPIISEAEKEILVGKYFGADVKSETKFHEFNWIVVIIGDPTSGYVPRHAPHHEKFQISPQCEFVVWGQSIESECPWIRDFDKGFGSESSVTSLKRMFAEISKLTESRNFEQIDRIFRFEKPHKYNLDFATGLLRATFIHRSRLPNWRSWLLETRDYLIQEGEDAESELTGLI